MLNGSVEVGAFRSSRYLLSVLPSMFLWGPRAGECVFASESQCRMDFGKLTQGSKPLAVVELIHLTPSEGMWVGYPVCPYCTK